MLITPQQADAEIRRHMPRLSAELRPLSQCVGRVLRQDVLAERDNPPFDRVCMDGIAIRTDAFEKGIRRFTMQAVQAAGAAPIELMGEAFAIEVMTGAKLPRHADLIVPMEQYALNGDVVTLQDGVNGGRYRNVQRQAEDGPCGVMMLRQGVLLGAPEIAIAASAGLARIQVSADPAFMVISTGDELVEPGEPIADQQVRRSNAYGIIAALRARGFQRIGNDHIADDAAKLQERLALHLSTHDVLILSGGISMGKFDLVPQALKDLGIREIFHRVAQRPGKPLWFGVGPEGQAVFGLPGNPVSTLVCLIRYIVPALLSAAGASAVSQERVALSSAVTVDLPLVLFLPVCAVTDEWGRVWAKGRPTNTSGDSIGLIGTDGFIELPAGPSTYPKEQVANLYRW